MLYYYSYKSTGSSFNSIGNGDYKIEIDLPGFSKDQIKVETEDNLLLVSAKNEKRGNYTENFDIKNLIVDISKVKFENGVLSIILKKEECKRRKQLEIG